MLQVGFNKVSWVFTRVTLNFFLRTKIVRKCQALEVNGRLTIPIPGWYLLTLPLFLSLLKVRLYHLWVSNLIYFLVLRQVRVVGLLFLFWDRSLWSVWRRRSKWSLWIFYPWWYLQSPWHMPPLEWVFTHLSLMVYTVSLAHATPWVFTHLPLMVSTVNFK